MTDKERKLALYCLKASSDYHSEVCEECINYPNCDHMVQDDVTETIIKALEQEPLTDTEQRIFLAAMGREEEVCREEDEKYSDKEPYEDSLMLVCRSIKRKVKKALWE